MALVTEDGTGLADAESFCSVAFADAHLAERGFSLWATMSLNEKEASLRRATDYMEQAYRSRWAGYRVSTTQALSWPRHEVPIKDAYSVGSSAFYAADAVPERVKEACATLAFKGAFGDLLEDVGRLKSRTKVGPIEVEYQPGASPNVKYAAVDMLLGAFFNGAVGGMNMRLFRA